MRMIGTVVFIAAYACLLGAKTQELGERTMRMQGRRGAHCLAVSLSVVAAVGLACLGVSPARTFAHAIPGQDQLIPLYDNANPTD
jgi:hypothetical protein